MKKNAVLTQIITEVKDDFYKTPFKFLNERALVCAFYNRLLKEFKKTILIESETIASETIKKLQKGKRVHMEVTTSSISKKYGGRYKIDILVTAANGVSLPGRSYGPHIPSNEFKDDKVLFAIEIKFYRRFPDGRGPHKKILREAEEKNLTRTIDKLKCIKSANKKAAVALVFFSNSPIELLKYDEWLKGECENNKIIYEKIERNHTAL